MQHLCFFLYNKSNTFIIAHAARLRKILFPSDQVNTIPSKSVTKKQTKQLSSAFCVKNSSIFLQDRFMYPTSCASCSFFSVHFCCFFLAFCD